MSEYTLSQVSPTDKTTLAEIDALLQKEGIRRDGNLDYICAIFDEDYHVIGTGSCFGNTLRCFAVSSDHQGEGLLNQIITLTGGRSAEEVVFNSITSGASNDIEKATSTARAMITRFGMSDSFDMMELETVNNPYLGNDTSLVCSADSAAQVDLNCVMTDRGQLVEIQGTGEGRSFTIEEQRGLVDLCAKGIRDTMAIQQAAIRQGGER